VPLRYRSFISTVLLMPPFRHAVTAKGDSPMKRTRIDLSLKHLTILRLSAPSRFLVRPQLHTLV
jgi:hypothetical protein